MGAMAKEVLLKIHGYEQRHQMGDYANQAMDKSAEGDKSREIDGTGKDDSGLGDQE